ncbi:hypothetical protein Fmac_028264 [Flemingia macrophylla]|uniref:Uncharacterized protein n=1 Tax=Flemingia macrophylla TaxID=520843 RepID=A0ABD1L8F6_9FABA
MSPTMNPLSFTRSFGGISSNLVSMDMLNNDLGDLAPMVRNLSNLRSVLMQCDTEFQLSKQVHTITDELYGLNSAELEITSEASWRSYVIGIGSYQDVFNTLSKSIYEGLAMTTSESSDVSLPGDNYPYWLAHVSDGHSVYFVVPEGHHMKGMTLCVLYLSTPENSGTDYLISVLMVNYTKRTIQLFKKDTVISFNNVDWQGIKSHLGSGDKLEFFVIFRHGLVVKKTAIYLMCDESIDMEMEPSPDPNKNAFIRFIWKFIFCKR